MAKHRAEDTSDGRSTSERNVGGYRTHGPARHAAAQETTPLDDRGNGHASHGSTDTASQPNIGG